MVMSSPRKPAAVPYKVPSSWAACVGMGRNVRGKMARLPSWWRNHGTVVTRTSRDLRTHRVALSQLVHGQTGSWPRL